MPGAGKLETRTDDLLQVGDEAARVARAVREEAYAMDKPLLADVSEGF